MAWTAFRMRPLLQAMHHPWQLHVCPNLPDARLHAQLQEHHQQQGSQEVYPGVQGGPDQAGGCSASAGPAAAQASHWVRAESWVWGPAQQA